MADLSELKQKVTDLRNRVAEKLNQIGFLKSWREKQAQAAAKGPDPLALSEIYKQGSTWTRIQVVVVYLLALVTLISGGFVASKLMRQMRSSEEHEKLVKDVSHDLEMARNRAIEKADVVSLGVVSASAYVGPGKFALLNMDLWIRVNNPDAAAFADKRFAVFHDRATGVLDELYQDKVSLLTLEGKQEARKKLRASFNKGMPEGQLVEEVFIQNLMVQ